MLHIKSRLHIIAYLSRIGVPVQSFVWVWCACAEFLQERLIFEAPELQLGMREFCQFRTAKLYTLSVVGPHVLVTAPIIAQLFLTFLD